MCGRRQVEGVPYAGTLVSTWPVERVPPGGAVFGGTHPVSEGLGEPADRYRRLPDASCQLGQRGGGSARTDSRCRCPDRRARPRPLPSDEGRDPAPPVAVRIANRARSPSGGKGGAAGCGRSVGPGERGQPPPGRRVADGRCPTCCFSVRHLPGASPSVPRSSCPAGHRLRCRSGTSDAWVRGRGALPGRPSEPGSARPYRNRVVPPGRTGRPGNRPVVHPAGPEVRQPARFPRPAVNPPRLPTGDSGRCCRSCPTARVTRGRPSERIRRRPAGSPCCRSCFPVAS